MKRSVAITGPTPQFVRWAIEKDCGLRDLTPTRLPVSTFQQLRGVRAIALGEAEGRTFKGFCFSGSLDKGSPVENVKAIPIDEVLSLFGSETAISAECLGCSANAKGVSDVAWAGCFGFLAADPCWSPESSSPDFPIRETWVGLFDSAIAELDVQILESWNKRPQNWYGVWQTQVFEEQELENLQILLSRIAKLKSVNHHRMSRERVEPVSAIEQFTQLTNAVSQCHEHGLKLHCELVPAGFSDGISWIIQSHCGVCKISREPGSQRCKCCGSTSCPIPPKRSKVLGDRPYLLLHQIIGLQQTADLFHEYLNFRFGET